MLVVLAGAADTQRDLTRERTRSAMAAKGTQGQRVGEIPYGSDPAEGRATLVPNEREQAIIRDSRGMRVGGMPLEQVAENLTERGIPTRRDDPGGGATNPWPASSAGPGERDDVKDHDGQEDGRDCSCEHLDSVLAVIHSPMFFRIS